MRRVRPRRRGLRPVPTDDDLRLQFRTIHGYRRAYRCVGEGPALLLIHGIGDTSDTWLPVLPLLAEHYTVIAPDLLGHGSSDKPRADYSIAAYACGMRDLLTVLGVDRVTVVGHSLGGGVAMQFAYQFPERCERLVLVASGGVGRAVNPVLRALSAPGADWLLPTALAVGDAPLVPGTLRQFGRLAAAFGLGIGTDAEDLINGYTRLKDPVARKAFFRTLRSVVDPRGQHVTMLDRCYLTRGMPTMLMWGGHDPIIPSSHAYVARAAMPGSRLEMFPQAGHFPHRYDPQRFADTVHDFVANTPPAVHDAYTWRTLLRDGPAATVASQPSFVAAAVQSGQRSGV